MSLPPEIPESSPSLPPYFRTWRSWFDSLRQLYGTFTPENRSDALEAVHDYCEGRDCQCDPALVYIVPSDSSQRFIRQCPYCWSTHGTQIAKNSLTLDEMSAAPRGVDSQERWRAIEVMKSTMLDAIRSEAGRRMKDEYAGYLLTGPWREKRRLALERDNYVCQGCLLATATTVHHLTYTHVQAEFLFELVSVCDECHRRLHPGVR